MRLLPSGTTAVLAELTTLREVLDLYWVLTEFPLSGTVDVIPASRTVLVVIDPKRTTLRATADALRRVLPGGREHPPKGLVEIRTWYDGPDLWDVAELLGCTVEEIARRHSQQEWTVAFCGFSPGFGYLIADGWDEAVPRRHSPRPKVPAGSVGLGGEFTGVYPRQSPGGWRLIGHTDVDVFDATRDPAALFRSGVRVRFVRMDG